MAILTKLLFPHEQLLNEKIVWSHFVSVEADVSAQEILTAVMWNHYANLLFFGH